MGFEVVLRPESVHGARRVCSHLIISRLCVYVYVFAFLSFRSDICLSTPATDFDRNPLPFS